jgi:hypothetical protein
MAVTHQPAKRTVDTQYRGNLGLAVMAMLMAVAIKAEQRADTAGEPCGRRQQLAATTQYVPGLVNQYQGTNHDPSRWTRDRS